MSIVFFIILRFYKMNRGALTLFYYITHLLDQVCSAIIVLLETILKKTLFVNLISAS
jgi:hypothetical protein